ncbi:MAG: ferrous iron transport protein A [Melioribacteraceae bacterium]|nr:ferrous iron transport protein A [Melioribacteraceae bacterium]MCF8265029.1 ferrous iron transport protein A [Melioribacteraceae bacterium]MCF8413808.1 ferrous iron transport protein A [Melioribacteraceae bacterium]
MSNATLNNAKKGNFLTITQLPEGNIRSQLIRLGLLKGQNAECLERLPGGTIILQKHRQEIAIGSDLARQIDIYIH